MSHLVACTAFGSVAIYQPQPDLKFSASDVKSFLKETDLEPDLLSDSEANTTELGDLEKDKLGIGVSKFTVTGKWSTFRFFGPNPAGAGLTGELLSAAQTQALGKENDTVPVTTAVHTIDAMMDNYFSDLLLNIPGGAAKLPNLKVQGAYYSPQFAGKSPMQYDNAFVVGFQSMILLPNRCFSTLTVPTCKSNFFSAGHDPSVVAHELGHIIFNHMRLNTALEGFQWFAVNEAYSDYFASSYFNEPVLGKIWKSNVTGFRYLRSGVDSVTITDPALSEEVHRYSNALSSALWRIRLRSLDKPREFDRVVLQSIGFLGESQQTRLGDAGLALLKSAEVFGLIGFKSVIREELSKSGIEINANSANAEVLASEKQSNCGVIGKKRSSPFQTKGILVLLLCPLFFVLIRHRGKGA